MIIDSRIISDTVQIDDRRHVVEEYIFDDSTTVRVEGLRERDFDVEKEMADRASLVEAQKDLENLSKTEILEKENELSQQEIINNKLRTYAKSLSMLILLGSVSLTDEEIILLNK